jgi:sulfur-oxidizing protein SoxZ
MASALINMPRTAKSGEIILIRALIGHPMETGLRPAADGRTIPQDLIRKFTCTVEENGKKQIVFSADLFAAIAANPYLSFNFKASNSCTLYFNWQGDKGFNQTESVVLSVS